MPKAYYSTVINADVDTVWPVVRDFGGLAGWMPGLDRCEIIEGPHADAVGCVRRLTFDNGGIVIERLVGLDDVSRAQTYEIIESPFPLRTYRSTVRVTPITETNQTFAEWWTDYEAQEGATGIPPFDTAIFGPALSELRSRHANR